MSETSVVCDIYYLVIFVIKYFLMSCNEKYSSPEKSYCLINVQSYSFKPIWVSVLHGKQKHIEMLLNYNVSRWESVDQISMNNKGTIKGAFHP